MANTQSKIDSLKKLNSKLLVEITNLRKENAEIPELRKKYAEIEAENVKLRQVIEESIELKTRFEELERKNKTDTAKLTAENTELKDRVTKLEQKQTQVITNVPKAPSTKDILQPIDLRSEDASLHNAIASEETIIPEIEHNPTKSEESEIRCSASPSATSLSQDNTSKQMSEDASDISDIASNSKSLEDKMIDEFLDEAHKKRVSDGIRQRKHEEKLQCGSPSQEVPSISQNTASTSHERKNEQGLIREMISSKEEKHVTEISANYFDEKYAKNHVILFSASKSKILLNLTSLYQKACDAEKQAIKVNQDEITCWYYYIIEFDNQVRDLMKSDNIGEKGRSMILLLHN